MKSYSQHGEDKWICENLHIPEIGFFVDIGAGGPVKESNTLLFESMGWEGICIEPDTRRRKEWVQSNRKCIIRWDAIGSSHGVSRLYMRKKKGLSSIISNSNLMEMKTLHSNKKIKKTHKCIKKRKVTVYT